jgi:GxxExxY protein
MKDSHEGTKARRLEGMEREPASLARPLRDFMPSCEKTVEELSAVVVDCAYKLHVEAGPSLLETVYEVVLARMLADQGLVVKRQVPIPIQLMGLHFDEGFRADLLLEDRLLVELKSVECLAPRPLQTSSHLPPLAEAPRWLAH